MIIKAHILLHIVFILIFGIRWVGLVRSLTPGIGSDPDFNMKLWKVGVRIFKGLNSFKVYHFGSITTFYNKNIIKNKNMKLF